jgi:hypothetical protein
VATDSFANLVDEARATGTTTTGQVAPHTQAVATAPIVASDSPAVPVAADHQQVRAVAGAAEHVTRPAPHGDPGNRNIGMGHAGVGDGRAQDRIRDDTRIIQERIPTERLGDAAGLPRDDGLHGGGLIATVTAGGLRDRPVQRPLRLVRTIDADNDPKRRVHGGHLQGRTVTLQRAVGGGDRAGAKVPTWPGRPAPAASCGAAPRARRRRAASMANQRPGRRRERAGWTCHGGSSGPARRGRAGER